MRAPKAESGLEPEGLSQAERSDLVEVIAEQTNNLSEVYKDAPNWKEAEPYMALVGLVGFLQTPTLDGRHLNHLRKMIAYEYVDLPKEGNKPHNTPAFLKEVREQTKAEIGQARKFKDKADEMPRLYRDALEDLSAYKASLIPSPLVLALRQSVRIVRSRTE
jgi:hypothetical protein